MKNWGETILSAALILIFPIAAFSQTDAVEKTRRIVGEIIGESFPELKTAKIEVKTFQSETNYFKSRFSIARFFTPLKLHYIIFVNPEAFRKNAPIDGIRAILAHELAHVLYYQSKNRFQLFGLANLINRSFNAAFERRADLEAIARGYGVGLKSYRRWLYENIPTKAVGDKKRDYFSPEEIDLMLRILSEKPGKIEDWRRRVPRNLREI